MKLIRFIKEFTKQNKWGYLWASIVLIIGSLIIYGKDAKVFDLGEWILWLPLSIGLLFLFSIVMGFFLFYGGFE